MLDESHSLKEKMETMLRELKVPEEPPRDREGMLAYIKGLHD